MLYCGANPKPAGSKEGAAGLVEGHHSSSFESRSLPGIHDVADSSTPTSIFDTCHFVLILKLKSTDIDDAGAEVTIQVDNGRRNRLELGIGHRMDGARRGQSCSDAYCGNSFGFHLIPLRLDTGGVSDPC